MSITADQQSAIDEVREFAPGYEEAEAFYKGQVEELFASPKVRRLLAKSGLNDLDAINFAKIPVNTILNRLEISSITAQGSDGADLSKEIQKLRDRNLMDFHEADAHKRCGSLGDVYLLVWPATDEDENVAGVDIRVLTPFTTRMFYDHEDPFVKAFVVRVWTFEEEGRDRSRANFYYRDRIERYITEPRSSGKGTRADDWIEYSRGEEESVIENPYDEIPIFHMRNEFPYGVPDHKDAFVPQTMINKLVTTHAATIDFQGFPQRFFLLDPTVDDPDSNEDDDDDPENPYNTSNFRADPGEVWLKTAQKAGQFEAAKPDTFIAPFNRYVLAMAQVTSTAIHEFDRSGNIPSGESLKVADAPAVKVANRRKLMCGSTWRDVYTFALDLMGFKNVQIAINWKSSASEPGEAEWKLAEAKIRAGVPRRTVFLEMGYAPDVVEAWGFTEQQPNGNSAPVPVKDMPKSA